MDGYQPERPHVRYRAVMDGRGGLVVEERNPWWLAIFCGRYTAISRSLKDHAACDDFVARRKLEDAGKTNAGLVVKEYR